MDLDDVTLELRTREHLRVPLMARGGVRRTLLA
jgi:hypothetical protein